MSFRPLGFDRHRLPTGRDACLQKRLAFLLVAVPAQPVAGACQLPRRLEVFAVDLQAAGPHVGGASRAVDIVAVCVERIGILRLHCGAGENREIQ